MYIRRPSDIGALVRAGRIARGLKQDDLASRLGVSRWWVNEFEKGKPTARLDLVLRALNELQIGLEAHPSNDRPETNPASVHRTRTPHSAGFDAGAFDSSAFDIDAIADTGLAPPAPPAPSKTKNKTAPATKSKTKRERPR